MQPLCVSSLELPDDMHLDPKVCKYVEVLDRTTRAERVSDPDTWTREQREAYERGDWRAFSRLRGYTEGEIDDFKMYLDMPDEENLVEISYRGMHMGTFDTPRVDDSLGEVAAIISETYSALAHNN